MEKIDFLFIAITAIALFFLKDYYSKLNRIERRLEKYGKFDKNKRVFADKKNQEVIVSWYNQVGSDYEIINFIFNLKSDTCRHYLETNANGKKILYDDTLEKGLKEFAPLPMKK
jgi:hypothetical protein